MVEPLSRPAAPQSVADRARAWVEWFGTGRLVAASLATLIVRAGAYWLVHTPPPPTEAGIVAWLRQKGRAADMKDRDDIFQPR